VNASTEGSPNESKNYYQFKNQTDHSFATPQGGRKKRGEKKKNQKTHADAADDFYFCELFQSLLAQKALSTLLGGEKAQQNNTELNSRANSEPTQCHCIFAN
jgi:hypothetical protein